MLTKSIQCLRKWAIGLVFASLVLCTLAIIADVGINCTPYETRDSAGRTMGFNDHLSREHYQIILSHFRISVFFTFDYIYTWVLLAMHGTGVWLLIRADRVGLACVRRFFAVQGLLFPLGWLGFLVLPFMAHSVLNGTMDREGMTDAPFIAFTAHPIWIATAMIIFVGCRGGTLPGGSPKQEL